MLLEETDASGVAQADYIYFEGRPIATLNNATGTLYFLHDDMLGTPQLATGSNQAVAWQASYDPFGQASVSGTITQNLRLPGQYFDIESGWNHNGFRDYVPQLGRYLEPDPLALQGSASFYNADTGLLQSTDTFAGGINSYACVANDPIDTTDPKGLAQCVYSISAHTMVCQPNGNPGQPAVGGTNGPGAVTLGPNGVFSGLDDPSLGIRCKNKPACEYNRNQGPIPPGRYKMNENFYDSHQRFSLEPYPNNWQRFLRDLQHSRFYGLGAQLHHGHYSEGCINANEDDPAAMRQYEQLFNLLAGENPNNWLSVTE